MSPKSTLLSATLSCTVALLVQAPGSTPSLAADPHEVSKEIIAVQIRRQGFECTNPTKAERDTTTGNPDDPIWTLTCENATYRVHLVPNMAAKVERTGDGVGTGSGSGN